MQSVKLVEKKSVRNVDRYQFDGTNACETIQTCAVHMI